MMPGPYATEPLEADEREFLLSLYRTRCRIMLYVYIVMALIAFVMSRRSGMRGTVYVNGVLSDARMVTPAIMRAINFVLLEGMVLGSGCFFFFRKIRPLKLDAESGVKEKIPYRVIMKELDLTGQYYVALDDDKYMHHLLSEDAYYNCNVGDCVYVYRAAKSKFIFEGDGHYSIL